MSSHQLSSYAFNTYGNDAALYNGIHEIERRLSALKARNELLEEVVRLASNMILKFEPLNEPWDDMIALTKALKRLLPKGKKGPAGKKPLVASPPAAERLENR